MNKLLKKKQNTWLSLNPGVRKIKRAKPLTKIRMQLSKTKNSFFSGQLIIREN
jgi:hypothetical protein